jgi:hypothetical protein
MLPGAATALRYCPELALFCVAFFRNQIPPNYGIALVKQEGLSLRMDMAHAQKIVDVVYAKAKGVDCFFTAS